MRATGSFFAEWGGKGCSGTGSCKVTMDKARTVTATFQLDGISPTLIHSRLMSWTVKNPQTAIPITATITDNVAVQGATLYYRTTGMSTYSALTLTAPSPTFNWTIPAAAVATAGVQYYLEARETANNLTRVESTPPGTPYAIMVGGTTGFTDDPRVAGTTPIKAVHFTELRTAISAVRTKNGLFAFTTWTELTRTPGSTPVKRVHLVELRAALTDLNPVYKAKYSKDITYNDLTVTAGTTPIKANHLSELRAFVRALE